MRPRTPASPIRSERIHRSQTDIPHIPFHIRDTSNQWRHMAETYAWVVEQEFIHFEKNRSWIPEPQVKSRGKGTRGDAFWREEMLYAYELEAEQWMRHQEEARRRLAERERARANLIQEEIRRVEERVRQKREAEKRRIAEERYRMMAELNRRKASRMSLEAWKRHEERWAGLNTSSEPLAFSDIPWPLASSPLTPEQISPTEIKAFLLSPLHSQDQTRKDRIRHAQLRWHPDRFSRFLKRVRDEDKAAVEEGAGIVARIINEMMAEKVARG